MYVGTHYNYLVILLSCDGVYKCESLLVYCYLIFRVFLKSFCILYFMYSRCISLHFALYSIEHLIFSGTGFYPSCRG